MSDIKIGSEWFNKCDGVDAIVKSVGSDCVGFTQIINGKEYFYSHTAEEFKEYYKPLVQADMRMSNKTKSDNVKRIRLEMVESMKRRKRVDDDSDLVQLVIERMANDDGDYVELEMVNQPKHYNDESGVPCCDVTDFMMFNGGNCFKYLYRCGSKFDDIEDLKKAAWYAERAWIMNEVVPYAAIEGIEKIAAYRTGNIQSAMHLISEYDWYRVEWFINEEVAMLGGSDD